MLDRVILTNDDGIDAPGMAVLEEIAAQIAKEVWVVAPEHDQSGQSHAISLHHAIRVSERGHRRFGVTGTPGDCAAMGICHLMKDAPPQLMLSGVNRGVNLGIETVFSGTVGGAMTAMMLGVPAIALSQAFTDRRNVPWDTARTLGARTIQQLVEIGWAKGACLNVNFPPIPADEVGPNRARETRRGRDRRNACGYEGRSARPGLSLAEFPSKRPPAKPGNRL